MNWADGAEQMGRDRDREKQQVVGGRGSAARWAKGDTQCRWPEREMDTEMVRPPHRETGTQRQKNRAEA